MVSEREAPEIIKTRGAISNTEDRYNQFTHEATEDGWYADEETTPVKTTVTIDSPRTIIAHNQSPDLPFYQSINPYRGCEHGCVYCYARPTHAYLGLSPGLDFETRLLARPNAAELLRKELRKPGYRCSVIALGTNTDPYQPIERRYKITRGILEVLAKYQHPVTITTKSTLIQRDIEILSELAQKNLIQVQISVTTLDNDLSRRLEPRAAAPLRRIETIRKLSNAGIPTTVLVAPVIPFLNDKHLESILEAAAQAGAHNAAYIVLRLPLEIKQLFKEWLTAHEPLKAEHVMSLVRQYRDGRENDATFGRRMRGTGEFADLIRQRFQLAQRKFALNQPLPPLDETQFLTPQKATRQLSLF